MPILAGTPLHFFIDSIRRAAGEVLTQALASPWNSEIATEASEPLDSASELCLALSVSGGVQGSAAIHLRNASALLLAQKFLAETPESSAELDAGRKEAIEELMRQVAGAAATLLKSRFGEVQLNISLADVPTLPEVTAVVLCSESGGEKLPLELRCSPELLASFPSEMASTESEANAVGLATQPKTDNRQLERVLDVNLKLSLRFGKSWLSLREILNLGAGSVIELDRRVQEPADLILGDKLLARGEVVVVDGNYGLRITEVINV
jgi:flagellar motor switch protein FliN/FliY